MKDRMWWIRLALTRIEQAIADLKATDAFPEHVRTLEGIQAGIAAATQQCQKCGRQLDSEGECRGGCSQ